MKLLRKLGISIILLSIIAAILFLFLPRTVLGIRVQADSKEEQLIHQQDVWIYALEWCESRGKYDALNPKDLDGTPSYSNFQWKPSTLLHFAKKYHLILDTVTLKSVPDLLENYELQREILRQMIQDDSVVWTKQFPDCVKYKIGYPPK